MCDVCAWYMTITTCCMTSYAVEASRMKASQFCTFASARL